MKIYLVEQNLAFDSNILVVPPCATFDIAMRETQIYLRTTSLFRRVDLPSYTAVTMSRLGGEPKIVGKLVAKWALIDNPQGNENTITITEYDTLED